MILLVLFANDRVEQNLTQVCRFYYTASMKLCFAHLLFEDVRLTLAYQAGKARLSEVFKMAGFGHFRLALQT